MYYMRVHGIILHFGCVFRVQNLDSIQTISLQLSDKSIQIDVWYPNLVGMSQDSFSTSCLDSFNTPFCGGFLSLDFFPILRRVQVFGKSILHIGSIAVPNVRGIELSAKEYPTFHILGYNVSPDGKDLNAICREMKQSRDERKYQIADYLIDKGIHISLPEVEELAVGVVGKPHFAQVLVRHGYAANVQDAFTKYLNKQQDTRAASGYTAHRRQWYAYAGRNILHFC